MEYDEFEQEPNLRSTVNNMGELVTQIIISNTGTTKTYKNVISSTIEEGKFVKMKLKDGRMIMVNTSNVFIVEVFKQKGIEDKLSARGGEYY